jgi:hypothetical protein
MIGWYLIINRKDVDGRIPNHVEGITLRGEKKEESHESGRIFRLLRRFEL